MCRLLPAGSAHPSSAGEHSLAVVPMGNAPASRLAMQFLHLHGVVGTMRKQSTDLVLNQGEAGDEMEKVQAQVKKAQGGSFRISLSSERV